MASRLFFLLFLLSEAASEPEVVRVGPEQLGQDVTLKCQAGNVNIIAVEWTRSDLVYPDYVLFYSDGHSDPTHQHSSFRGRVQLVDGELKNGNVSLILKNVSREDVGTYECRVETAGSRRKKRDVNDVKLIKTVQLQVTDPENQKGGNSGGAIKAENSAPHHVGLGAAVGVVLVCLAAVVV